MLRYSTEGQAREDRDERRCSCNSGESAWLSLSKLERSLAVLVTVSLRLCR